MDEEKPGKKLAWVIGFAIILLVIILQSVTDASKRNNPRELTYVPTAVPQVAIAEPTEQPTSPTPEPSTPEPTTTTSEGVMDTSVRTTTDFEKKIKAILNLAYPNAVLNVTADEQRPSVYVDITIASYAWSNNSDSDNKDLVASLVGVTKAYFGSSFPHITIRNISRVVATGSWDMWGGEPKVELK